MKRADAPKRFIYDECQSEGKVLQAQIVEALEPLEKRVKETYREVRAQFLSDRDEEIWLPLMTLCKILCPERMRELQRTAVDLCSMKTQDKQAYKNLSLFENQSEQHEFAEQAAVDLLAVINGEKVISTAEAVEKLRELDLSPWRTYRGKGLDQHSLGDLLASIGIPTANVRYGKQVLKSYRKLDVEPIVKQLDKK